ncbi:MAG: hypothetical protein F6K37_15735 [Moorea sp. SIO4E2]|uniref:hypothetical protein n=1 Tax=Moorena sp. SIO4E2 TaxID=2607826 RepID=UPI0013BCAAC3|nr:hypothetical protein [Moorena sp. SIO4E2]NEQ07336.1 hypothetical protein [Moorena sp. SIO4E2]
MANLIFKSLKFLIADLEKSFNLVLSSRFLISYSLLRSSETRNLPCFGSSPALEAPLLPVLWSPGI